VKQEYSGSVCYSVLSFYKESHSGIMGDRHNMIVCYFDPWSPRITALNIHEWIYECLHIPEENILMIQIDGVRRRVYIKFTDEEYMNKILQGTEGHLEYKHDNGEISQVQIVIAGMGTKKSKGG